MVLHAEVRFGLVGNVNVMRIIKILFIIKYWYVYIYTQASTLVLYYIWN